MRPEVAAQLFPNMPLAAALGKDLVKVDVAPFFPTSGPGTEGGAILSPATLDVQAPAV